MRPETEEREATAKRRETILESAGRPRIQTLIPTPLVEALNRTWNAQRTKVEEDPEKKRVFTSWKAAKQSCLSKIGGENEGLLGGQRKELRRLKTKSK